MEDLSADDDILSDILLDNLEFEPAISTHKMNPNYRGQRFDRNAVSLIVRKRVVVEKDITAAIEDLGKLGIIQKYLVGKTQRQTASFQAHARRYLESYLPESGVEFALTTRYKRVMMERAGRAHSADAEASTSAVKVEDMLASPGKETTEEKGKSRSKGRSSLDRAATSIGALPAASEKADLCVLAMRTFKPGELINYCKGGLKDLTKSEDEALREEATTSREKRKDMDYKGVLGPGRDFSVIRSARKGCSQLLLGPARFVNHDCNPNTEFYRMGATMVFKVIRPINRNEEVTTFYGENYFEWGNAECMCATCEARGTGVFSKPPATSPNAQLDSTEGFDGFEGVEVKQENSSVNGTSTESNGRRQSRRSSRPAGASSALPSPSPTPSLTPSLSTVLGDEVTKDKKSKRDYLADLKLAEHGPSEDRSDPWAEGAGPKCRCLTCGATFWAPEKWWTPDECPRCERHYKIFKADWPGRVPTEGSLARKAGVKRKTSSEMISDHLANSTVASPSRNGKERSLTPTSHKTEVTPKSQKTTRPTKALPSGSTPINSPKAPLAPLVGTNKPAKTAADSSSASANTQKPSSRPARAELEKSVKQGRHSVSNNARSSAPTGKNAGNHATSAKTPFIQENTYELDSDGSDLTPEPESEQGETGRVEDDDKGPELSSVAARSHARQEDRSSSSISPGPSGPKMLGKNAKTDVLAQYWGAPEGDRRARRKALVSTGPTLLAARRTSQDITHKPTERRSSFRESSTDEQGAAKQKRRLVASLLSDAEDSAPPGPAARSTPPATHKHRKTSSMNNATPAHLRAKSEAMLSPDRQELTAKRSTTSPDLAAKTAPPATAPVLTQVQRTSAGNMPGLATSGVERTSESNLALFWSAGVGGTRNRRPAQREPQTLLVQTVPSKRQRNASESSRSRTPEVKKPRGSSRTNPGNGEDEGSGRERWRRSQSAAASDYRDDEAKETSQENSDMDEEEDDNKDPSVRPYMFSAISKVLQSNGDINVKSAFDAKGPLLPSAPLFRPPGLIRPDLAAAAARANSPLAGPPRGAPGQPMRKNLRWGSGKSSVSRPLGPNGSPLGRSPASLNGSPVSVASQRPEDVKAHAPRVSAPASVEQRTTPPLNAVKSAPEPVQEVKVEADPTAISTLQTPHKEPVAALPAVTPGNRPEIDGLTFDLSTTAAMPKMRAAPVQDALSAPVAPDEAASPVQDPSDPLQRRTSGRARRAPEMAAGQISYKGSLVKLAAQRAKEAKVANSVDSPRSSPDSRHQSPKWGRRQSLSDAQSLQHSIVGNTDATVGNGKDSTSPKLTGAHSPTETVDSGTLNGPVVTEAAATITSANATSMDVDS